LAPKPIRKEAGTVGIPSIVVKAANPLRIKSVNGVFALTFTVFWAIGTGDWRHCQHVGRANRNHPEVCAKEIFYKLFREEIVYMLSKGALEFLSGTLPEGARRNLRWLFARAFSGQALRPKS
jgi:hypothetical protein